MTKSPAGKKHSRSASHPPARPRPAPPAVPPAADPPADVLTLEQAIAALKTTRPTFYRWLREGKIRGLKAGWQWRFKREDIERFMRGQGPAVNLPVSARPLIELLTNKLAAIKVNKKSPAAVDPHPDPVTHAVNLMIALAHRSSASDLHLSAMRLPDAGEPMGLLQLRIAGVLHEAVRFDARLLPAVIARWKTLGACNIHETAIPQDGRIMMTCDGQPLDIRMCVIPTQHGESLTARLLGKVTAPFDLSHLPYTDEQIKTMRRWMNEPHGLIVITGPTGTGKTTTLYAMLSEQAGKGRKIMTAEDPVEYDLPGIVQSQINAKAGVSFGRLFRSFMRSDPDILMLGEIRGPEELELCIQAAMTGHLVLTTLHADDGAAAMRRMVDIGVDPFMVSDTVRLIISQRLFRKLCPKCSVEHEPTAEQLETAMNVARTGGMEWTTLTPRWRKAVGCEHCARTGYQGRAPMTEILEGDEYLRRALREGATVDQLRPLARRSGSISMAADGLRKAAAGETSLDELFRAMPRV